MRELQRKAERPVACAREFRPKFIPPRSYLYINPRTCVRGEAAKLLGLKHVPTLTLSHLSPAERRAYMLAEIDLVLDEAREASPDTRDAPEDALLERSDAVVTQRGDLLKLGEHYLLCGDAREPADFARLMHCRKADLVFTDPPYNVRIDGNVCGLGSVKHREFAFASGEMSEDEFTRFLCDTLGNAASVMRDGAIAFVCMDWRHMGEFMTAGRHASTELKNLVVWNKTNGGRGTTATFLPKWLRGGSSGSE